MRPALAVVLAAALTVLVVPVVRRLAFRLGVVAQPGGRHPHARPTPTAGGVALFVAFWVALLVGAWPWDLATCGMFLGSLLLLALCVTDDALGLPVAPRLIGHLLVALVAWQYGVRIEGISAPVSALDGHYLALGWLSLPLTVAWIVFMINAVNWIDGLDGLAAGVIGIASITLALMAYHTGFVVVGMAAAVLAACSLCFLLYNFNPARIFMGDTGAMFLGFIVACLSVVGAFKSTALVATAAPLLVLGVPIYEAVTTVARRLWHRRPVYRADRGHLHHRLMDKGLTVRQTVLVIYALTAALCLVAVGLWWK